MSGQKIIDGLKDAIAGNLAAITLRLPVPPSTNNLFANVAKRGRVRTERYRTWQNAAGWELKAQRPVKISGPVKIEIVMRQPRANADCDNRFKAPIDLLVAHGVIDDDRNVRSASIVWGDVEGCLVTVRAA